MSASDQSPSSPSPAETPGPGAPALDSTAPGTTAPESAHRVGTVFRTLAFGEAVSWALLLTAMLFKWVIAEDPHSGLEGGVPIAGPIHGALFVAYCLAALAAWRTFGWSLRTLVLAWIAAVPPFCTVLFERWADRRGLLTRDAGRGTGR